MKKYLSLFLISLVAYQFSIGQTYGNEIQAKDNPGAIGKIKRTNDNLKVYDSAALAVLNTINGKITAVNTGAVTISAALPAGTNNIGDVDVLTVPADPFGANADAASATGSISAKLRFIAATGIPITSMPTTTVTATNLSTNVAQINGVTPLMGAGNTGTGSLRVTIATDQATVPVSLASVPSHAVTNAGTFAVQESGTQVATDNGGFTDGTTKIVNAGFIYDDVAGTALTENDNAAARINVNRALVNTIEDGSTRGRYATVTASNALKVDNSGVTQPVSGTVSITSNSAVNVSQINGVTPLMGAGNGGTGSLRVNIASDQVAIPVTLTSTTITGTVAVTKSGTWDITNAGTFAVQPASATAPVNTMNSASANSGINSAMAALFDDVSPTAITENNFGMVRMSANHNLYGTIRDAAGNERGVNVNASNQLSVSVDNTVTVASHAVTNAGTFAVQESGSALTALQLIDNLPNTLGSTTSGQSGALALGAVTTAAPSYTTAQTNALSLTTTGSLRTDVMNTVTVSATNLSTNVAQINGVTPLMGNGTTGTGSPRVTLASDGTAISTTGYMSVKLDQTTPGTTNGVSLVPTTTGGLTTFHVVSAASTNATNVKASAGQLYGYYIFNANASARKIAFHNTSGTPTAGASVFCSFVIPASSGANVEFSQGIPFSSGIAFTLVTGTADSDATGVASGDLIVNLFYK